MPGKRLERTIRAGTVVPRRRLRAVVSFTVNRTQRSLGVDPETPLLWVLRDVLALKGTKYACGVGLCGTCTVLIDGVPNHACRVPLRKVAGREVTTIEGLVSAYPERRALLEAWAELQVPQCGYCQPAQIVSAAALLERSPNPSEREIDAALSGVLCRCGTYQRVRRAIRAAAGDPPHAAVAEAGASARAAAEDVVALDEWIGIRPDNTVVVTINHSEMGQGVATSLAMLVAEELEVDLAQLETVFAPAHERYANPLFGTQATGGSTSIRGEWERLRRVGAGARERLIKAAMASWGAKRAECRAEHGAVVHARSGRRLTYAELVAAAKHVPPPRRLKLKPASELRLIGKPARRLDIPDMVAGNTEYSIDVTLPGTLVAQIERCPTVGGRIRSFDAAAALAVPGVRDVVALEGGVAVVAEDFWSATRGRERVAAEWEDGPHAELDTATIYRELESALQSPGAVVRKRGRPARAFREASTVVTAHYRTPYLAHCVMEPPACVADVRADGCDLWVGTQDQTSAQAAAAALTGLPTHAVAVHTTFLGGGFGRRLETDYVEEAVRLSMHCGRPVQVVWTRADDLRHDRYRPAHAVSLRAGLDRMGSPLVWWQRLAGPGFALEMSAVPYAIPHIREEHVERSSVLPIGYWRGVGATQNAFVIESFVDELAASAERDPLEYRLALVADPRHARVLSRVAEAFGWGGPLPHGRGRGIALYASFGSCVAQAAEVSVGDDRRIRVHRVVCAIDCGQPVNPDGIRAQLEGGIAFGLSAALKEEIRVERGRVAQASFADYPILTLAEMPEIETHIIESSEHPGGVGEPAVPVIAPAVANAVFAVTRRRLRSLPLVLGSTPRSNADGDSTGP
jgi:isoquinoline 1-oxidoreductase beta subunit